MESEAIVVSLPPLKYKTMTEKEHKKIHLQLHRSFDELAADWLDNQPLKSNKKFSNTTIMELMEWSYQQTLKPTKKEE